VLLLIIDMVLFTVAVLATGYVLEQAGAQRRLAKGRTREALAAAGVETSGNLLGTSEARSREGVYVAVTNGASYTRPGDREPTGDLCVARVFVPLVDQIVCKAGDADAIMGPLPAAPRVRTGHAGFDEAYAVFVGSSGGRAAGSYRDALVEGDTPWAQTPVLDGFLDLGLHWMRVHDGTADLVFPKLAIEDVVRATALAHAVERAGGGKPMPLIARGSRIVRLDLDSVAKGSWAAGIFPGFMVGVFLGPTGGLLAGLLVVLAFLAWGSKEGRQTS
jgi:hypothetical protein